MTVAALSATEWTDTITMRQNKLGYFIKAGFESIFTHGFMSFASVCIIVACLLIMGSFTLVALNVNSIMTTLEDENQIVAYVNDTYSESQAMALESEIRAIPNVALAEFISNSEAFDSFKEQYEDSSMLEDLESDVLRHRFVVFVHDLSEMEQTREDLIDIDGIDGVSAHLKIANSFITLRRVLTAVSIVLIGILLIVSLFIISNTIKLTTFERKEEIAIMKMVGATSGFIRGPFIVEGMTLGLFGALSAYIVQWGIYQLISQKIIETAGIGFITVLPFAAFAIPLVIAFLAVGLIVGMLGSSIAIRNYLRV